MNKKEQIKKELKEYRDKKEEQEIVKNKKNYIFKGILFVFNKFLWLWGILLIIATLLFNLEDDFFNIEVIQKQLFLLIIVLIFSYSVSMINFYKKEIKQQESDELEKYIDLLILKKIKNIGIGMLLLSIFLLFKLIT